MAASRNYVYWSIVFLVYNAAIAHAQAPQKIILSNEASTTNNMHLGDQVAVEDGIVPIQTVPDASAQTEIKPQAQAPAQAQIQSTPTTQPSAEGSAPNSGPNSTPEAAARESREASLPPNDSPTAEAPPTAAPVIIKKVKITDADEKPAVEPAHFAAEHSTVGHPTAAPSEAKLSATKAAKSHSTSQRSSDVEAATSLRWLTNGNTRFTAKRLRADGRGTAERAKTMDSTTPHAIVLSCSDSRVAPEIIFDQGIGEIETIRVSGPILDNSVIASIESAIERSHPHLLVVLGHTRCEAVAAAMKPAEPNSSTVMTVMRDDIRSRLKSEVRTAEADSEAMSSQGKAKSSHPDHEIEAALNADGIARELTKRSEIVRTAVESGNLLIKSGVYWVDSGRVRFY